MLPVYAYGEDIFIALFSLLRRTSLLYLAVRARNDEMAMSPRPAAVAPTPTLALRLVLSPAEQVCPT